MVGGGSQNLQLQVDRLRTLLDRFEKKVSSQGINNNGIDCAG